jgi:hypothetical protein
MAARKMKRIEINVHEKQVHQVGYLQGSYQDALSKNIKCCSFVFIDIVRTVLAEVLFRVQSFFVAAVSI